MKVNECMCKNVICANANTTVYEVANLMSENHIGCVPICDTQKKVVGLVTDRDITLRSVACGKDPKTTPISDIMTSTIYKVNPTAEVSEASKMMCDCQIRRIPVIQDNALVGIITLGDLAHNENVNQIEISNTIEGICKCDNNPKNCM